MELNGVPDGSRPTRVQSASPILPKAKVSVKTFVWGVHLTGVGRRLGQWNVPMPAPTTLSLLGSFRLGSRLMQTAWTTWNGCDGLAASSARPVVIREDGGLGTAGSCVLDAVAAHQRWQAPSLTGPVLPLRFGFRSVGILLPAKTGSRR